MKNLYNALLSECKNEKIKNFLNNNDIVNLLKDFDQNGYPKKPLRATAFNDYYRWIMIPVISKLEDYFSKKGPIHVTFAIIDRSSLLKYDKNLFNVIKNNLKKLLKRKFDRTIFEQVSLINKNDIDKICGPENSPYFLADTFLEKPFELTSENVEQVVMSAYVENEKIVIEISGPWHRINWVETSVMQNVYESALRYRLKNENKSYAKWIIEALERCDKTINAIKELEKKYKGKNLMKGALFTGRRTGGYAYLLLQNLYVSQNYKNCLGTSSFDVWCDLKKNNITFKLNPVGTIDDELIMIISTLFPRLDKYLPLSALLGHYLYYRLSNKSKPIVMLPDTYGTKFFMKGANIIKLEGKSFLDIFSSARQDSGGLDNFVKIMVENNFRKPLISSNISNINDLEEAWEIKYDNSERYPYKMFGTGGFFGDSENSWDNGKEHIDIAIKPINVYLNFKLTDIKPYKISDGNKSSFKLSVEKKVIPENKLKELQKLWDKTLTLIDV